MQNSAAGRRAILWLPQTQHTGNLKMPQNLLAWANLAAQEDFCAVLFLSLSGLDFSFWLVSRGFLLAI